MRNISFHLTSCQNPIRKSRLRLSPKCFNTSSTISHVLWKTRMASLSGSIQLGHFSTEKKAIAASKPATHPPGLMGATDSFVSSKFNLNPSYWGQYRPLPASSPDDRFSYACFLLMCHLLHTVITVRSENDCRNSSIVRSRYGKRQRLFP